MDRPVSFLALLPGLPVSVHYEDHRAVDLYPQHAGIFVDLQAGSSPGDGSAPRTAWLWATLGAPRGGCSFSHVSLMG